MTAQELSSAPLGCDHIPVLGPDQPPSAREASRRKTRVCGAVEAGTGREGGDHGLRDSQRGPRGVGPTGLWGRPGCGPRQEPGQALAPTVHQRHVLGPRADDRLSL